jgi:hypothetical protein
LRTSTSSAEPGALPDDADHLALHDAFVRLSRDGIERLLTGLVRAVETRDYPAGRPYRHVNGFTKVVAAEYPCGARLTLHYWPAADDDAADDVSRPHDHRFPFASFLLGGAQSFNELVEDDAADDRWQRFVYRPYLRGRVASVSGAVEVGLRRIEVIDRAPLDGHYATSSTGIHQAVTVRRSACATLVLRGPRERRTSQVYYRSSEAAPRGGLQLGRRLPHDVVLGQVRHALRMVSGT